MFLLHLVGGAHAGLDGLEDWTYDEHGLMRKRHMSGNDIEIKEEERWFKGLTKDEVESVDISEKHW